MKLILLVLAVALAGCAMQDVNNAREMKVGDSKFYFGSAVAVADCQELLTAYLFAADGTPVHAAQHGGPNLGCAILKGSGAAAVGAGLGIIAAQEHRPDETNVSQSQAQSQGQSQKQSQPVTVHLPKPRW